MAAKVQTKIEKVTARAGIFCAESYFRGFQLDKLINEVLGVRSKVHNGFQWDEVILPLFDTCLCGRQPEHVCTDTAHHGVEARGNQLPGV